MTSDQIHLLSVVMAQSYAQMLRAYLGDRVCRAMVQFGTDPDDYLDSNLLLAEAFEEVFGRPPILPSDVEAGDASAAREDIDIAVWNGAAILFREFLPWPAGDDSSHAPDRFIYPA